jgi:hypothetical protein
MKIKYVLLTCCLIITLGAYGAAPKNKLNRSLSKESLFDKVRGAWAGKTIGCTYGGPTEFRYVSIIPDSVKIPWGSGEIKKWFDGGGGLYDDVYVDFTFVETIEKYGLDASPRSFAADFLAKGYPLCHANQMSRYNLLRGLNPPESGYWKNNPHADCLDFQIEADFAGIMSPGMVNSATDICDRVGHIMSYGDGWYGGVYVAAMYSLAYVSNDINFIVTEALKEIPSASRFYKCMSSVIKWHQQYPDDWKKCWEKVEKGWAETDITCPDGVEAPFNIETCTNAAYIIIGLLYGQGDFEKTIDISTRCGQDSDCNPSSAGGILGTMLGYRNIPEKYRKEMDVVANMPFNNSVSFNKACDLSFGHALKMIQKFGGKTTNDDVKVKYQKPKPTRLEVSFEGLKLDKKVTVNNWIANFPAIEFNGIGAVIKGNLQGKDLPLDYVADLEVYFNDRLIEVCKLPIEYNHRKHELFFNYVQPFGKYKISCKWTNPVKGANIWVGDVITYTTEK